MGFLRPVFSRIRTESFTILSLSWKIRVIENLSSGILYAVKYEKWYLQIPLTLTTLYRTSTVRVYLIYFNYPVIFKRTDTEKIQKYYYLPYFYAYTIVSFS